MSKDNPRLAENEYGKGVGFIEERKEILSQNSKEEKNLILTAKNKISDLVGRKTPIEIQEAIDNHTFKDSNGNEINCETLCERMLFILRGLKKSLEIIKKNEEIIHKLSDKFSDEDRRFAYKLKHSIHTTDKSYIRMEKRINEYIIYWEKNMSKKRIQEGSSLGLIKEVIFRTTSVKRLSEYSIRSYIDEMLDETENVNKSMINVLNLVHNHG